MKRVPTSEDWDRLAELTAAGYVRDDESLFALDVIQRFDPARNDSLVNFFKFCRSKTNKRSRQNMRVDTHRSLDWAVKPGEHRQKLSDMLASDTSHDATDAAIDTVAIKSRIGQGAYAVLSCRHAQSLSVAATAKKLGMSREAVRWIESESLRILSASSGDGDDLGYGG